MAGPPRRRVDRKTPEQITEEILATQTPTYFNTNRAWSTLGYCWTRKPEEYNFVGEINELWEHQAQVNTLRGRRAGACILDCLRTLGFRNPRWNVNASNLGMESADQGGTWECWDQLPGPGEGRRVCRDSRKYLTFKAPKTTRKERRQKDLAERAVWKELHRYQKFMTKVGNREYHFRAFPVPRGADSLWHSVSYWLYRSRHKGGRSIWSHWEVKARIWTYFMQVLKTSSHVRYAEYHMLQHKSKVRDHDFGMLSLARSLYASQSQGKPAYPHDYLLYVIAEYFCVQIILMRAGEAVGDKMAAQGEPHYAITVYGDGGEANRQIVLVTNDDRTHYDQADLDRTALHDQAGYDRDVRDRTIRSTLGPADGENGVLAQAGTPYIRTRPGNGDMGPPVGPCRWWSGSRTPGRRTRGPGGSTGLPSGPPRTVPGAGAAHSPADEARYNYLLPEERASYDARFPAGVIPAPSPLANAIHAPPLVHAPRSISGIMAHRLDAGWYGDVVLTDAIWERFAAGIDIPGEEFGAVPDAWLLAWEAEGGGRPPENARSWHERTGGWQWRFGPDPMGLGLGPREWPSAGLTAERSRLMLDGADYVVWEDDKWRVRDQQRVEWEGAPPSSSAPTV